MSRVPPSHTLGPVLAVWGSGVRIPLAPLFGYLMCLDRTPGHRPGGSCDSYASLRLSGDTTRHAQRGIAGFVLKPSGSAEVPRRAGCHLLLVLSQPWYGLKPGVHIYGLLTHLATRGCRHLDRYLRPRARELTARVGLRDAGMVRSGLRERLGRRPCRRGRPALREAHVRIS